MLLAEYQSLTLVPGGESVGGVLFVFGWRVGLCGQPVDRGQQLQAIRSLETLDEPADPLQSAMLVAVVSEEGVGCLGSTREKLDFDIRFLAAAVA